MKNLMFLVIVADVYFAAQSDPASVRVQQTVNDFQDRGFSGAVVSDDRHALTAVDLKIQIRKERLIGRIWRDPLRSAHHCRW